MGPLLILIDRLIAAGIIRRSFKTRTTESSTADHETNSPNNHRARYLSIFDGRDIPLHQAWFNKRGRDNR